MKDVFSDFEWDRAFIQSGTRAGYGGVFGYDTGVDSVEIWADEPYGIIFMDDVLN